MLAPKECGEEEIISFMVLIYPFIDELCTHAGATAHAVPKAAAWTAANPRMRAFADTIGKTPWMASRTKGDSGIAAQAAMVMMFFMVLLYPFVEELCTQSVK